MTRITSALVSCLAILLAPPPADACGNTTHAWISFAARDALPPGPLKALLSDPAVEDAIRNGTLFPDGGYPIGDGYGEMAHWEPFQDTYLAWIKANHAAPFTGDAARHVAFLFGMASHGMADQFYDAVFMEISKARDAGWSDGKDDLVTGFDSVTDFHWASLHGKQADPPRWFPGELFEGLYSQHFSYTVTTDTMRRGADLVGTAIVLAGQLSEDEYFLRDQERRFPWAFEHMDDLDVGAPRHIAYVVAAYWMTLWARLNGGDWTGAPVLHVRPANGVHHVYTASAERESRVSIVFSRGLSAAAFDGSKFTLVDDTGTALPFTPNLFYREASHVVNLRPEADFVPGRTYTISVAAGVTGFDGSVSTVPFTSSFVAGPAPEPEAPSSSCAAVEASWLVLVGGLIRRKNRDFRTRSRAR